MEIEIDQKLCIGCGTCEAVCPKVFEVIDGHSQLKKNAKLKPNQDCIEEAIKSCPVDAISKK